MKKNSLFMLIAVCCAMLMTACGSQKPAPVVDRSGRGPGGGQVAAPPGGVPAAREARDGIYTVQRGDTLDSVSRNFRVDPRDLARWNEVGEGSVLRPGQTLRVTAPPEVATVSPITGTAQ